MDYLMTLAADPAVWVALGALIAMEVVLGIDNLIFISILTNKLPEQQRARGRRSASALALILRLGLLSHRRVHRAADRRRCSRSSARPSPGAT